jgi:hypothetical protein
MSNPSYIASNPEELFDNAPEEIKGLIQGEAVNEATAVLGKIYKLPVSSYVSLENIISYTLIGALKPEDVLRALRDILGLSDDEATKLAGDMETSILEKARIKILGKSDKGMVTMTLQEGRTPDELRKEILNTTKRVSPALNPPVVSQSPGMQPQAKKHAAPGIQSTPGSRTQLLEDLRVLDSIPKDDEVAERLQKIQEQIVNLKAEQDATIESPIPLQDLTPKGGQNIILNPTPQTATYSKAPEKYNVDPYREVAEN